MFVSVVNMLRTRLIHSRLPSSSKPCVNYLSSSLIMLALTFFPAILETSPVTKKMQRPPINDKMISYLSNFGYLPASDIETGNLRTDEQLKEAIRTLQMFGNIPATGEFDEKTQELLNTPRCGLPDIQSSSQFNHRKKRYTLQGPKWTHTNLTWSLRSKFVRNLEQGRTRSVFHRALNVWSKDSKLTFREMNSDDADILIYFERGYHNDGFPFDGSGHILAHAFFPGSGRGGDAHFDEDENWDLDIDREGEGTTNLLAVAAHEFGHSLGLSHSTVSGSLMYPWYQGLKGSFELPEDDRDAIQTLYGVKDSIKEDRYPNRSPERAITTPNTPSYQPPRYNPPNELPRSTPPPYEPPRRPPITSPPGRNYPHSPPNRPSDSVPNTCDTSYDAISEIRGELFIFKDRYVWRIGDRGLTFGYPASIDRLWNKLPAHLTHVDAVYERNDKKIVFFVGREIYMFNGNSLLSGYPKPLTSIGLPASLDHVDTAMVWGYNSRTYFFSGSVYWRYDDEMERVELADYPRPIANIWKGVSDNIDAAFRWKDGATYFFKGKGFWKFDDSKMRVFRPQLIPSATVWMGCPKALEDSTEKEDEFNVGLTDDSNDIFNMRLLSIPYFTVLIALVLFILILCIVVAIFIRRSKTHSYMRPRRLWK